MDKAIRKILAYLKGHISEIDCRTPTKQDWVEIALQIKKILKEQPK